VFGMLSFRQELRLRFQSKLAELGSEWRWGYETTRDASGKLAQQPPEPAVLGLRDLVERAWYGSQVPDEAWLASAREFSHDESEEES
jgi:hypothetical protein